MKTRPSVGCRKPPAVVASTASCRSTCSVRGSAASTALGGDRGSFSCQCAQLPSQRIFAPVQRFSQSVALEAVGGALEWRVGGWMPVGLCSTELVPHESEPLGLAFSLRRHPGASGEDDADAVPAPLADHLDPGFTGRARMVETEVAAREQVPM